MDTKIKKDIQNELLKPKPERDGVYLSIAQEERKAEIHSSKNGKVFRFNIN